MKALVVSPGFSPPGGIQYVGRLMLAALRNAAREGDMLRALSFHAEKPPEESGAIQFSNANGNRLQFVRELRRQIRRDDDAIILNHVNFLPYVTAAGMGRRLPPLYVIMHGIEAWRRLSLAQRLGLRHVKRFVYVSDFTRRRCTELNLDIKQIDSVVCHHGLLPDSTLEVKADLAAPSSRRFVLMIGRIASGERYKGYEEMIRAWSRIRESRPDLELSIVGEGDDRLRLEAIARELGQPIVFHGQVSDEIRDQLIRDCESFALPSWGEGFGLVYLEAMRVSKPVIAGANDAGAEVIVDDVTGRAVDPKDEPALIQAVLDVTSERGCEMGLRGRQRFEEQFTFEAYAERFLRSIEHLSAVPNNLRGAI